jgi:hypothetical protein
VTDRTIHAEVPGIVEVVRYDRAGKWYIEPLTPGLPRQHVTVTEAAEYATFPEISSGRKWVYYPGLPGGKQFDRKVKQRA